MSWRLINPNPFSSMSKRLIRKTKAILWAIFAVKGTLSRLISRKHFIRHRLRPIKAISTHNIIGAFLLYYSRDNLAADKAKARYHSQKADAHASEMLKNSWNICQGLEARLNIYFCRLLAASLHSTSWLNFKTAFSRKNF